MRPVIHTYRLLVCVSLLAVTCSVPVAVAQSTRSARELPEDVRAALERVEDFSFSFSQPGFYAVLEYVKTMGTSPGQLREPLPIDDWTVLLERPADFRGLPITIEGVVGRNKVWRFEQDEHRHLGTVWQLELWRADQPITATVILTDDAGDIPINATIRVTGYFVMVRQYHSGTKQIRQAALLVGHGPTLVSQTATLPETRSMSKGIVGLIVTATVVLLVTWILLRRSVARTRRSTETMRAGGPAPVSLADDLAAWAAEEPEQQTNDDDRTDRP